MGKKFLQHFNFVKHNLHRLNSAAAAQLRLKTDS